MTPRSVMLLMAAGALVLSLALPASAQLPQGFVAKDIGDVGVAGSTTLFPGFALGCV